MLFQSNMFLLIRILCDIIIRIRNLITSYFETFTQGYEIAFCIVILLLNCYCYKLFIALTTKMDIFSVSSTIKHFSAFCATGNTI